MNDNNKNGKSPDNVTSKILGSKRTVHNFIVNLIKNDAENGFDKAIEAILAPVDEKDEIIRLKSIPALERIVEQGEKGEEIKLPKPVRGIASIVPIYASISIDNESFTGMAGVFLFKGEDGKWAYILQPTNDEEKFNIFYLDNKGI